MAARVENGSHKCEQRESRRGHKCGRGRLGGAEGHHEAERGDNLENANGNNESIGQTEWKTPVAGAEGLGPALEAEDLSEPYPEKHASQDQLHEPIQICHRIPCLFSLSRDLQAKSLHSGRALHCTLHLSEP